MLCVWCGNVSVCALFVLTGCLGMRAVAGETAVVAEAGERASQITFEEHVLPIFRAKCIRCHAGAEPEQGLRLTSRREILRGGESGPAIRVAAAESSLLWERLAANEMPKGGSPLSAEEKGVIRTWINEGAASLDTAADTAAEGVDTTDVDAVFDHWSFRPPVRPDVPQVADISRVRNPVDSFVLSALENRGLTLSPEAPLEILARRAWFGLTGLPPTAEELRELQEFAAGDDQTAFETMIDRLLDSPHYGERWGRYWLDIAGYADSAGVLSEDRPLPTAWRYRDYVIRALNDDKPYDRFLQEQIAGDELTDYWEAYESRDQLPAEVIEAITATGYLRCAPDASRPDFDTIKNADAQYFYPTLHDTLQIVVSSTMGLTLQCARCHSHKYDPIQQTEYYQLQSVLMAAYRPQQWIPQMERRLLIATAAQQRAADEHNGRIDAEIANIRENLPEGEQEAAVAAKNRERIHFDELRALYDLPGAVQAYLLRRGDALTPGPLVEPGVPAAVRAPSSFDWQPPGEDAKTSGRRLAFARWLTQPDHPLTARVMVNRIWLHHFGEGIVSTPEDFGTLGSAPDHPQLLDWLSTEFVNSGWSIKHMHRLIMSSGTWRQHSVVDPVMHREAQRIDPENRLLWRQRLRRLEAEALRDAMLSVSGLLDRTLFGHPIPVARRPDGDVTIADGQNDRRRSIYVQVLRGNPLTLLHVHDQPVMEINCIRRSQSTVSTQALTLMNSDAVLRCAQAFADRIVEEEEEILAGSAFTLALSRSPSAEEQRECRQFLSDQQMRYADHESDAMLAKRQAVVDLCQMLLVSNEFIYID